jgi:phospholipid/cholesterol/gamma-HCH transport system substrate-binding protein
MRLGLRRRRKGRKRGMPALMIAAIVIIVPLLVIYYAFTHKLPLISSQYTDYAIVPNSVNVRGGSPVRISGINVGSVTGVSADGDATKIAFTLNASARPIHTDATVTIRDRLFLEGGYYLDLFPGSPTAPAARQGFTIAEKNTATPVQFFQLLSTFDVAARSNLAQLLNTANIAFSPTTGQPEADSGAGGLKQAIPQLTPVLKNVAWISEALRGTHYNDLQNLLSSASDVTSTLAQHQTQLADLITGLRQTAGALAADDGDVASSISGLDQTLQEAPATLTAVDRSLPPLTRLARALTPALEQSPALVSQLTSEVRTVDSFVKPAARGALLSSLTTLLASFPSSLTQLAKFFPPTQAATACLADRIVPLLNETVKDGALSTGDPVWEDLDHMLPGLAGASGDFDANGPYLRVLAGVGSDTLPAGLLGSVPGLGDLVGALAGGSSSTSTLQGISPNWVGDLTATDFRPDVSCTSQPLPTNLVANPSQVTEQPARRSK